MKTEYVKKQDWYPLISDMLMDYEMWAEEGYRLDDTKGYVVYHVEDIL